MAEDRKNELWSASYAGVEVYQIVYNGIAVMRRLSDSYVNATQILKCAQYDKLHRTRFLEKEVHNGVHEKVQGGYGKYQGTWVPLEKAVELAKRLDVYLSIKRILEYDINAGPKPPTASYSLESINKRKKKNKSENPDLNPNKAKSFKKSENRAFNIQNPAFNPKTSSQIPTSSDSQFPRNNKQSSIPPKKPAPRKTPSLAPNLSAYQPPYVTLPSNDPTNVVYPQVYVLPSPLYNTYPQANYTAENQTSGSSGTPQHFALKYPPVGFFSINNNISASGSPQPISSNDKPSPRFNQQSNLIIRKTEPDTNTITLEKARPVYLQPAEKIKSKSISSSFGLQLFKSSQKVHSQQRVEIDASSSPSTSASTSSSGEPLLTKKLNELRDSGRSINDTSSLKSIPNTSDHNKRVYTRSSKSEIIDNSKNSNDQNAHGLPALLVAAEIHLASGEKSRVNESRLMNKSASINKDYNFAQPRSNINKNNNSGFLAPEISSTYNIKTINKAHYPPLDPNKNFISLSAANITPKMAVPAKLSKVSKSLPSSGLITKLQKPPITNYTEPNDSISTTAMNFVNLRNFLTSGALGSSKAHTGASNSENSDLLLSHSETPLPRELESFVISDKTYLPSTSLGSGGLTAIHYAARAGHLQTIRILRSRGFHSEVTRDGRTPLMLAASSFMCWKNSQRNVFPELLDIFGGSITKRDKNGQTVVHYIANGPTLDFQTTKEYLNSKNNLNTQNQLLENGNNTLKKSFSVAFTDTIGPNFIRSSSAIEPAVLSSIFDSEHDPKSGENAENDVNNSPKSSAFVEPANCSQDSLATKAKKADSDSLSKNGKKSNKGTGKEKGANSSPELNDFQNKCSAYYSMCLVEYLRGKGQFEIVGWRDYKGKRASDVASEKGFNLTCEFLSGINFNKGTSGNLSNPQKPPNNTDGELKVCLNDPSTKFSNMPFQSSTIKHCSDVPGFAAKNSRESTTGFNTGENNRKPGLPFETRLKCELTYQDKISLASRGSNLILQSSSKPAMQNTPFNDRTSNNIAGNDDYLSEPETVLLDSSDDEGSNSMASSDISKVYGTGYNSRSSPSRRNLLDELGNDARLDPEPALQPHAEPFQATPMQGNCESDENIFTSSLDEKKDLIPTFNSTGGATNTANLCEKSAGNLLQNPTQDNGFKVYQKPKNPTMNNQLSSKNKSGNYPVFRDYTEGTFKDISLSLSKQTPHATQNTPNHSQYALTEPIIKYREFKAFFDQGSKSNSRQLYEVSSPKTLPNSNHNTSNSLQGLNGVPSHQREVFYTSYPSSPNIRYSEAESPTVSLAKNSKKRRHTNNDSIYYSLPKFNLVPAEVDQKSFFSTPEKISTDEGFFLSSTEDPDCRSALPASPYKSAHEAVSEASSKYFKELHKKNDTIMRSLDRDIEYTSYLIDRFSSAASTLKKKLAHLDSRLLESLDKASIISKTREPNKSDTSLEFQNNMPNPQANNKNNDLPGHSSRSLLNANNNHGIIGLKLLKCINKDIQKNNNDMKIDIKRALFAMYLKSSYTHNTPTSTADYKNARDIGSQDNYTSILFPGTTDKEKSNKESAENPASSNQAPSYYQDIITETTRNLASLPKTEKMLRSSPQICQTKSLKTPTVCDDSESYEIELSSQLKKIYGLVSDFVESL